MCEIALSCLRATSRGNSVNKGRASKKTTSTTPRASSVIIFRNIEHFLTRYVFRAKSRNANRPVNLFHVRLR